MKDHERRLGRLEETASSEVPAPGKLLSVLMPECWPDPTRDAFFSAQEDGDTATMARVIESQTGETPAFGHPDFHMVIICQRPDGPQ